jgi:signal transduction histidine kinase
VFLPLAVALLVGLSLFTLLSYRNAIALLGEQREAEALAWAERIGRSPDLGARHPRLDLPADALRVVLLSADGLPRHSVGEPLASSPFGPVGGAAPRGPAVVWSDEAGGTAVAFAPVGVRADPAAPSWVRVDLRTPILGSQTLALRILTVVVVTADVAVALWLILFLRRVLSPYDALLATARAHASRHEADEADYLLRTLERALGSPPSPDAPEPELELLERTLGTSLEEGLLLLDREGRALVVNPRARGLLDLPPTSEREDLFVLLASHPRLLERIRSTLDDGEAQPPTEVRLAGGRGDERRVAVNVTPLRRLDGDLIGFLVLLSDVTQSSRQADERRLAESLTQLGELAAGVAHELRNGLATVRGYLQLLERSVAGEDRRTYLEELDAETRHLERVVTDFLSFARPGTARPEAVDLAALARRLARRPESEALELSVPEEPVEIPGDPVLLHRALDNLLRNAREATAATGAAAPVVFRVERAGRGARIEIADRGLGLPAEVRERLFVPFTTTKPDGAGLGLALAHRVVALHGGNLRLEDREGGGTRAVVWLPASAESDS